MYKIKPLKLKQNRLPLQFSIIVPSVSKDGKKTPSKLFLKRVDNEKEFLDNIYKGDTSVKSVGSYLQVDGKKKKVVSEQGVIVEVSTTPEVFNSNRNVMEQHIKDKQKDWNQSSIFYKIEGEAFIYPKQKYIPTTKENRDIEVI